MSAFPDCRVTTESGTRYEFRGERVLRHPQSDPLAEMRRDHSWLRFALLGVPTVGQPLRLILEPLSSNAVMTFRTTSLVTEVVVLDAQ